MTATNEVYIEATKEDREYAWRHAFAYADQFVSTDDAIEYANHYAKIIENEDEMRHWPGHTDCFGHWAYFAK